MCEGDQFQEKRSIREELLTVSPELREMYLYLTAHHHAAQTYIGVARMNMSQEDRERLRHFEPALESAWVDHLLFICRGVPYSDGELTGVFNITAEQIAASRERGSLLEQEDRRLRAVEAARK